MQFSSAVTTVTREYIVPKNFDTINRGTPTLYALMEKAKAWTTGYRYEVIYQYANPTNGGNTGIADKLSTDRENTRVRGSFEPKMAYQPIVVADIEQVLNMGDERVISLIEVESDTAAKQLSNVMATNLFQGTGSGNSWDSLAMAADDGTNYSSYATLSRTTYPTLDGYYLASAGALTLNKMATAYDAVTVGTDVPDMISTTKTLWSAYEALLTPTVRAGYAQNGYPSLSSAGLVGEVPGLRGNQGFSVLWFRGTPIIRDEQVPSGKMFFINSEYFGLKGIDLTKVEGITNQAFKGSADATPQGVPGSAGLRNVRNTGFNFRQMMSPVDQLAKVGYLIMAGDFCSTNPRLQGQMSGLS